MTAKRRNGEPSLLDWGALSSVLSVGAFIAVYGLEALRTPTGLSRGDSIGPYIFLGSDTLLAAAGDIRILACCDTVGTRSVSPVEGELRIFHRKLVIPCAPADIPRDSPQVEDPACVEPSASDPDDFLAGPRTSIQCLSGEMDGPS